MSAFAAIERLLAAWTSGGGIHPVSEEPDAFTAMASSTPCSTLEEAQKTALKRARAAGIDTWACVKRQVFDPMTGHWADLESWFYDERTLGGWRHETQVRGDPTSSQRRY